MIYNIQALRALAASLVLFVHLGGILNLSAEKGPLLEFGNVGVDLFFVISGFVMVHTVSQRPIGAGKFFENRLARVAPLYWALTLAVGALSLVAPAAMRSTEFSWVNLLKSFLFIPYTRSDGLDQPILFLGWTLNYEMFFYALFAGALFISKGSIGRTVAIVTAMLAFLVAFGMLFVTRKNGPIYFYMYPIILEFGYGMVLGLLLGRIARLGRNLGFVVAVLGTALLIALPFLAGLSPRFILAGVPATMIVAGALAMECSGVRATSPLLQLLGASSYALYLTHPFVFRFVMVAWRFINGPTIIGAIAAFCTAFLVAVAIHLWLERPLNAWIRRRLHRAPAVVDAAA